MSIRVAAPPRTAPQQREGSVRDRVLDAAIRLFASEGYFRTSLPDIQRAAGVSIGAIYHHFEGKDDLAAAVYDGVLERMERVFAACLSGEDTFQQRFSRLLGELFALVEEEPELVEYALYVKHREISQQIPPVCSSAPFVMLQEHVKRAMDRGELRRGDVVVATATLMGPAIRLIQLRLDGLLDEAPERVRQQLVENARRALSP
jgi:AcrR family transcriptional regulator